MEWAGALQRSEAALGASCARLGAAARLDPPGAPGARSDSVTQGQVIEARAAYRAALAARLAAALASGSAAVAGLAEQVQAGAEEDARAQERAAREVERLEALITASAERTTSTTATILLSEARIAECTALLSRQKSHAPPHALRGPASAAERALQLERQAALLAAACAVPAHGDPAAAAEEELVCAVRELEHAALAQDKELATLDRQLGEHAARLESMLRACQPHLEKDDDMFVVRAWIAQLSGDQLQPDMALDARKRRRLERLGLLQRGEGDYVLSQAGHGG
jgi:hypothetical protein